MINLRDWRRAVGQLFFPANSLCAFCAKMPELPIGICDNCLRSIPISWQKHILFDFPCFSLVAYQGYVRDLIHQMKFQNGYDIACAFGFLLGLASREEPDLQQVDLILPVPLHENRMAVRGFNQTAILADNIIKAWKRPVFRHLIRVRDTKPQSGLSSKKRRNNLSGAFAVLPGFDFQGKRCLIVDDVTTSGHTFTEVARLVEQYGGYPLGLFVARTEVIKE